MPTWLIWVITTVCGAILGYIGTQIAKDFHRNTDKYKELKRKEEDERLTKIVNASLDARFESINTKLDVLNDKIGDTNKQLEQFKEDVNKRIDSLEEDIALLKKGTQASLRNDLYELREKYVMKNKYATLEEKREFEHTYKCYHNLGANGVMDYIYKEVMELPSEKEEKKTKQRLNS